MTQLSRPAYLRIADDLRAAISRGEQAPGSRLPTIARLGEAYGVSPVVVRQALAILRGEGLVDSRRGSGSYVRREMPMRSPRGFRYENTSGLRPPFATDAESAGATATWEHDSSRTEASLLVAARLGLTLGAPVMRVDYRFFADGVPIQVATSYEPLGLTAGTSIEWPESGPVYGVRARMESVGMAVEYVTEEVTARGPTSGEVAALAIPSGVPVMHIERTYWWHERPVEIADIAVPADRYRLRYRIPLNGPLPA